MTHILVMEKYKRSENMAKNIKIVIKENFTELYDMDNHYLGYITGKLKEDIKGKRYTNEHATIWLK